MLYSVALTVLVWPLGSLPAVPVPWATGPVIVVCVVFGGHCPEDAEGVSGMRLGLLLHTLVSLFPAMGGGWYQRPGSEHKVRSRLADATASRPLRRRRTCAYKHTSAVCAAPDVSLCPSGSTVT